MATSTKLKREEGLSEVFDAAEQYKRRKKAETKVEVAEEPAVELVEDARFADIEGNTFFKIMFDEKLEPEQKRDAVAQALTYTTEQTKEENKARLEAFTLFKEWLQFERKKLSMALMDLIDTEAMGELKDVYDQLNSGVLEFEGRMKPLTEIIDAVYQLRMAGNTLEVFREIKEDMKADEEQKKLLAEQEAKLRGLNDKIYGYQQEIATLGEQKGLFGFGGVKKAAREGIALKEVDITNTRSEIDALSAEIEETRKQAFARESKFAEFAEQKRKLKELLDISSEEHKERQKDLVSAAKSYVSSTETRVASVMAHLDGMSGQIENQVEGTSGMQTAYTIMNAGIKQATDNNQTLRTSLQEVPAGETDIGKLSREKKLGYVENFITDINDAQVDTQSTLGDLTTQMVRINSMRDANRQQMTKTRAMHSSSVAGVADRLQTVLQAVSMAAVNESSEMAAQSLRNMTTMTNNITSKEAIRIAMGGEATNKALEQAIDDLAIYGETVRNAREIAETTLTEQKSLLESMEQATGDVLADIKKQVGVTADVLGGKAADGEKPKARAAKPAAANANAPGAAAKAAGPSAASLFKKL